MPKQIPQRSLEEPRTERNMEGQEIGFTESLVGNTMWVEHLLNTDRLIQKNFVIGEIAPTEVKMFYMEGLADPSIVNEVESRLSKLKVDYVPHSIVITDELDEHGLTPFQGFKLTERFDSFTAALMGGRVGVIVDNTPLGIVVPHLWFENFYASGEYTQASGRFSSRLIRMLTFLSAVYVPAFYLDIAEHHPADVSAEWQFFFIGKELVPAEFTILGMIVFLRIISDLFYRVNKNLLFVLSILLGTIFSFLTQEEKIINSYTVLVIGFVGVTSMGLLRRMGKAITTVPVWMMIAAFFFDWQGIAVLTIIGVVRLAMGRSYGVPYLSPIFPPRPSSWQDTVFGRGKMKSIINRKHKLKE